MDLVTRRGLTVGALDTQCVRDTAAANVEDAEVVEVRLALIDRVVVGQDVDVLEFVLERVVVLVIGGVDVPRAVAVVVVVAFVVLDMGGEDVAVLELVVVRDTRELAVDDLEAVIDDVVVFVTNGVFVSLVVADTQEEAEDVLEGGRVLLSDGDADDVLEGEEEREVVGEALDVLDVVTEPVVVLDFAGVVLGQGVADCVLEDVTEAVLRLLAVPLLEFDTVFVEVIVAVVVFVDVEDGVIGLVGKLDFVPVVVFVDVFDRVTDCVGTIPRFLSR